MKSPKTDLLQGAAQSARSTPWSSIVPTNSFDVPGVTPVLRRTFAPETDATDD
jgi:hypothetical protein